MPPAFRELTTPSRFKAFYGGRGSAKSWSVARQIAINAATSKRHWLCCREIQMSIAESVKELLESQINLIGASYMFDITRTHLRGTNGSKINFAGLRSNAVAIKSMEDLDGAWVEEAAGVSSSSIKLLEPTVRNEGSEIWYTWNPETEFDAVDIKFRGPNAPVDDAIIRRVSYKDNNWFPAVLRKDMLRDYEDDPENADHVWGGGYKKASKHAYYARLIARMKQRGQITRVPIDPTAPVHVAWDLGIGQNMALTFLQFFPKSISVVDFIQGDDEAAITGLPWYLDRLRELDYKYGRMIMPHDANTADSAFGGDTREQALQTAGYETEIVPSMNPGDRIDLVKRVLPITYIDEQKAADLLKAMRSFTENWDEDRRASKGPLRNWAMHPADSFGHGAQAYEAPHLKKKRRPYGASGSSAWMGA